MPPNEGASELSDAQRDLLRSAVREGYFKVPRRITLAELSERHEIPDREASETMQRGLDTVVRCAVLDGDSCL